MVVGDLVGRAYPLQSGAVIGRSPECPVQLNSDDVSRRHAQIASHGARYTIADLGSMNGTLVNGEPVEGEHELVEGDKIQIGTTVLRFALFDDLDERYQARMFESALRDPLTRAFNRKYLDERIDSEFAYSLRHDTPLSLLLLDVDHFKSVNDSWGHPGGDAVLVQLAEHLMRIIRTEDVLARYGGEEFAIVSRGIDADGARQLAERVRASVERSHFMSSVRQLDGEGASAPQRVPLTVSVGVASMPDPEIGQPSQLVQRADDALYRAKSDGRNRVRVHGLR